MWQWVAELAMLGVAAFVQNMAFTWVSRSRNSGDPTYHRWAALCSNGIWFVTNVLVFRQIWAAVASEHWWQLGFAGLVYVLATSEGSVVMMRYLLGHEHGKRRVGAYAEAKDNGHASDCAMHDAPAYKAGDCTCGKAPRVSGMGRADNRLVIEKGGYTPTRAAPTEPPTSAPPPPRKK